MPAKFHVETYTLSGYLEVTDGPHVVEFDSDGRRIYSNTSDPAVLERAQRAVDEYLERYPA